jgi:hypothetical protein
MGSRLGSVWQGRRRRLGMDYRPTMWNRDQSPCISCGHNRNGHRKENRITYWTHNRSLPVKLRKATNVSIDLRHIPSHSIGAASRIGYRLTRSSPIGPAEHDEGGSLYRIFIRQSVQYERSLIEDIVCLLRCKTFDRR